MKTRCVPALLTGAFLTLAACGDRPTGPEPARVAENEIASSPPGEPLRAAEAPALPAGLRTAMTRTLSAALAELDLQPEAPMRTLHDFFQEVEAQQAERRQARGEHPRTVQP